MPDLQWNRVSWNEGHRWELEGDEWSVAWGGARSQWYGTIFPRICGFLPASRILEIAPGRGRWSQFLLQHCMEYFGVDLSDNCIQYCKRRFAAASRAHFVANDGQSLHMIPNDAIDFAFSYDSLVHVELEIIREYIWQTCQKLTTTGVAFFHHSNALTAGCDPAQIQANARAPSVSSALVKQLIEDCSGKALIQEEINWGGDSRIDCMTTFSRKGAFENCSYKLLKNDDFMAEAEHVRRFQSPYDLS